MKRIASFERISFVEFYNELLRNASKFGDGVVNEEYANLCQSYVSLPNRKTVGSAGYDFICPVDVCLGKGESVVIPTGVKCRIQNGWVLKIYPRSGLGFKFNCRLANTVGIIDSDYYNNEANEGHILIKIVNGNTHSLKINAGDRIAQGIFEEFGITVDDEVSELRNGGFGSTGR